ncbi:MAG: hypothetical protein ABI367_06300 [Mucilaginibacter sp.]
MKKINLIIMLAALATQQVFAQDSKLKNEQPEAGIWAQPIKVDGNLKEWNDSFQAYNKQTKLFYTISNDDKMLYLVVRSTDMQTSNKIGAGGISFIINTDGKKKDKDAFKITYPVIARTAGGGFGGFGGPGGARGGGGAPGGFGGGRPDGARGFNATPDSATLAARHKTVIDGAKEIKIFGFKDITDSLVSIYNEYGIKAALGYDAAGNYGYELAIPLKLLNISTENNKGFAYDIKVNGITRPDFGQRDGNPGGGGPGGGGPGGGGPGGGGPGGGGPGGGFGGGPGGGGPGGGFGGPGGGGMPAGLNDMFAATDFWGKYILAKK